MRKPLTEALPSNVVFDALEVENIQYDPVGRCYSCRVYGVCQGVVMPLIIRTAVAVRRVEDISIADAEIDAFLALNPDLPQDRVTGALGAGFQRLYALAGEVAE